MDFLKENKIVSEDGQPVHLRRQRYTGTHPKTFKDKYKELDPEKHADEVAKIIAKGNTPAGTHRPICTKEILEILRIKPGQNGLDATLGYGGHTREMLDCLNGVGHIIAIDVDPIELPRTKERLEKLGYSHDILEIMHMNFSEIDELVPHWNKFDFVLADFGVSSMQIDNPDRGFSFKLDGPLDLRLNPNAGQSAAERLCTISYNELVGILVENSDEPYADVIARNIISTRKKTDILTTSQLQTIIQKSLNHIPEMNKDEIKKRCQRCFQALRIDVNNEFEAIDLFLEKLPDALKSGGRVAILTFHSGEDRRVKKSFKQFFNEGIYCEIAPDPIRPTQEECRSNNRASSAKLRFAVRA